MCRTKIFGFKLKRVLIVSIIIIFMVSLLSFKLSNFYMNNKHQNNVMKNEQVRIYSNKVKIIKNTDFSDDYGYEKMERKSIINRFMKTYIKSRRKELKFSRKKAKAILNKYIMFESIETDKLIENGIVEKYVPQKLEIYVNCSEMYRVDPTCYWNKVFNVIPSYKFTYNNHISELSDMTQFCPTNHNKISFDVIKKYKFNMTSFNDEIIKPIEQSNITINNSLFLDNLPVKPLLNGGSWFPSFNYIKYNKRNSDNYKSIFEFSNSNSCIPKERIAILIAFRNRESNLNVFLTYMHFFLQKQLKAYKIFVIEQMTKEGRDVKFNKGRLYNAGYKYIMNDTDWQFNCIIMHDVDLIPLNLGLDYSCDDMPKHYSANVKKYKDNSTVIYYKLLSGGILAMRPHHYKQINGFSNLYFGWGGEDDDFSVRLLNQELCIMRPPIHESNYAMLDHIDGNHTNPIVMKLLCNTNKRLSTDGLSNIDQLVEIKNVIQHLKFTIVSVDVLRR